MRLKPAQRIEGYVCAVVPAKGVIPKLMVMPPGADDGPILRYDLRDRVTAFAAPIADPADPSGATALERVPAQVGTPYALRYYDVTVEKCETTTTGPNGAAGPNGETYLVITMLCRNETAIDMTLRFDSFVTTLTDADGVQLKRHNDLLAATSNTSFNQRVASGSETRVRCFFTVPKDVKPKTLAIKEADSRTYEYDVSQ